MAEEQTFSERVAAAIETVRPSLQMDGGDIEIIESDEDTGVVKVKLQGACSGCPMSQMTLKMGVERTLKAKVPAVKEVVAVS